MAQLNKQREELNALRQQIGDQQQQIKALQVRNADQEEKIRSIIERNNEESAQSVKLHQHQVQQLTTEKNLIIQNLTYELGTIKQNYEKERQESYQELEQTKAKLETATKSLNYRTIQCNELGSQKHQLEQQVKHITVINQ